MRKWSEQRISLMQPFVVALLAGLLMLEGCSRSDGRKDNAEDVRSIPDTKVEVSPERILKERSFSYGLRTLGYDAKLRRFTLVVCWSQESKQEMLPSVAQGMVLFLQELSMSLAPADKMATTTNAHGFIVTSHEWNNSLNLAGFKEFKDSGHKVDSIRETASGTTMENIFEEEVSFRVDDEIVALKVGPTGSKWAVSSAAAQAIEKLFEAAGGKIIDTASVTYRNGPRNGLTETAWLISLPFDKTNGVIPELKN